RLVSPQRLEEVVRALRIAGGTTTPIRWSREHARSDRHEVLAEVAAPEALLLFQLRRESRLRRREQAALLDVGPVRGIVVEAVLDHHGPGAPNAETLEQRELTHRIVGGDAGIEHAGTERLPDAL